MLQKEARGKPIPMRDLHRLPTPAVVLAVLLGACAPEADDSAPSVPAETAEAAPPAPPPLPEAQQRPWTSVHPTDVDPVPPPKWVTDGAVRRVRDGKMVVVASGSGDDAGNHPEAALAQARRQAFQKLKVWFAEKRLPNPGAEGVRVVKSFIGPDGRAYVGVEVDHPAGR